MIYILMGKSSSGKDSAYKELIKSEELSLEPLVIYTTRPMREGETNGKEYFFTDREHLEELRKSGRIIEERVYHTVLGDWYYFTADEGQIHPSQKDYLSIGTLESYQKIRDYFGEAAVSPLYIECSDPVRLLRAVDREKRQTKPNYKELCRRFLADEEDFSEEKLQQAGIKLRFSNDGTLEECLAQLKKQIGTMA